MNKLIRNQRLHNFNRQLFILDQIIRKTGIESKNHALRVKINVKELNFITLKVKVFHKISFLHFVENCQKREYFQRHCKSIFPIKSLKIELLDGKITIKRAFSNTSTADIAYKLIGNLTLIITPIIRNVLFIITRIVACIRITT